MDVSLRRLGLVTSHIRAQPTAPLQSAVGRGSSVASGDDVDLDGLAYGFMASQALFSALELGIFEHLSQKPLTASQLRGACGVDAPRLQTLLTALVAVKCLRSDQAAGTYTNSPNIARFMVQSSKAYYGDYLRYQIDRIFYHRMGRLTEVMQGGEVLDYQTLFKDTEVAAMYTKAQHNGSLATAKQLLRKIDLKSVRRVLDVGGGSGAFSIVLARAEASLEATVLDLPEVCAAGRAIAAEEAPGIASRVRFAELDAAEPGDWPTPTASFDVVLMSYLSGSVPETALATLYANALKALVPGGRLIIHDFMVSDTLDGPPLGALWALQHVTVNPQGLGLYPKDICDRVLAAGFARADAMEMIQDMTRVVVGHKQ